MLSSTVRMGFAPIVAAITHALGEVEVVKSLYTPPRQRMKISGLTASARADKELTAALKVPTALAPRYREPAYPYPGFERTPDAVVNEEEEKPAPVKKAVQKKRTVVDEETERLFGLLLFTATKPQAPGWYLTRVRSVSGRYFYHIRVWGESWSLGMSPFREARAAEPGYYLKGKPSFDQEKLPIEWARPATLAEINGL